MFQFDICSQADKDKIVSPREGELKLGESIACISDANNWQQELAAVAAPFVIIGLVEDVGVRANFGIGGAHTAWEAFLKSFLNIQSNRFLSGNQFILLGKIAHTATETAPLLLREATARWDAYVSELLIPIFQAGKIPIVIGGGHNNAFPLLQSLAHCKQQAVNVVNLDPHSDFRMEEGRHSGNGFRYAYNRGYLNKYAMLGLHESYNSEPVLNDLFSDRLLPIMWEDIFLRQRLDWDTAIANALHHVSDTIFGVELDFDCLEQALSSAMTPVGVTAQQAMAFLYAAASRDTAAYLHLPEAICHRADGLQSQLSGKLLSYLVSAFAKGVLERSSVN
jgi:formiminoglutamase